MNKHSLIALVLTGAAASLVGAGCSGSKSSNNGGSGSPSQPAQQGQAQGAAQADDHCTVSADQTNLGYDQKAKITVYDDNQQNITSQMTLLVSAGSGQIEQKSGVLTSAEQSGSLTVMAQSDSPARSCQLNLEVSRPAAGSLDVTFNSTGWNFLKADPYQDSYGRAMARQVDGKVLVAGYSHDSQNKLNALNLVRYNANGSVDLNFGRDGQARYENADAQGWAVTTFTDAAKKKSFIYVAGAVTSKRTGDSKNGQATDLLLVRFDQLGRVDKAFGTDGTATLDSTGLQQETAFAMAVQVDGKVLVAGRSGNEGLLARFDTEGKLDKTFGVEGKAIFKRDSFSTTYKSVQIQNLDGEEKILVAGSLVQKNEGRKFFVARYDADGKFDKTFDQGKGYLTSTFGTGTDSEIQSLQLLSDQSIVVGGFSKSMGAAHYALARYHRNGTDWTEFGNSGLMLVEAPSSSYQMINSIAIEHLLVQGETEEAIVFAGQDGYTLSLGRVMASSGQLDQSFGQGGIASQNTKGILHVTGMSSHDAAAMVLQADGRIILAGDANQGGTHGILVVRYGY